MQLSKLVLAISLLLAVGACGATIQDINVTAKPIERAPLVVTEPDNIILKDIQWYIINRGVDPNDPHSIETLWKELEEKYGARAILAITTTGYQDLTENLAKLQQLVIQQQAVIEAYRSYYNTQVKIIDEYNSHV